VRERAVEIDPQDDRGLGFERLAFLDRALDDKRIAFLGEWDHFIHEKYAYRAIFLRYLAARGFRWIGEEMSHSDGTRINLFVATGDESWLARVSAYGYQGDQRADRRDTPAAGTILEAGFGSAYPTDALRGEQSRMARAMREVAAAGAPIFYFGADVDYLPGGAYADIDRELATLGGQTFAAIPRALARVPNESVEDEIARLERAAVLIGECADEFDRIGARNRHLAIRRSLETLIQSLRYVRLAYRAKDWDTLRAAMAIRERAMAARVDDIIATAPRDARFVLMAHCLHLAKNHAAVKYAYGGARPGGDDAPALGTHLHRTHGDEIFSVWMLTGRGRNCDPYPGNRREFDLVPNTLNAWLAKVGAAYVVPIAGCDELAREQRLAASGAELCRLNLAEQADAICFIRDVTPLRA
jgi:erythromycin esterase-like protein